MLFAGSPRAAVFTWTRLVSGNASGSWTNQAYWAGATLPTGEGDLVDFSRLDIAASSTVTLDGSKTISGMTFSDTNSATAADWKIQAGSPAASSLTFGTGAVIHVSGLAANRAAVLDVPIAGTNAIYKSGNSFLQLTRSNSYSGGTWITNTSDARISVAHDNALGSGKVTVGGTVGAPQTWFHAAGDRTLTNAVEIRTQRFISDNNTVNGLAAGVLTLAGPVLLNQSGAKDFYINEPMVISGPISGTTGLIKDGGYSLTLRGTNSYTGATVSKAGTLIIEGPNTGGGSVSINGGTLTGSGAVAGPLTIADNATFSPTGQFESGSLVLNPASILSLSLGATNDPDNSFLRVNGNLTLDGVLNILNLGSFSSGTYTGAWYSGTLTDKGLSIGAVPNARTVLVQTNLPNYILFRVLEGSLNPAPGQQVPMDLASPLALSWVEVPGAALYDVFVGTSSNAVYAATTNTAGVYQGRTATRSLPFSPQPDTTWFWRVDAIGPDGTITKGAVYAFSTGSTMYDLMADTWVATDALNRVLPSATEAGPLRTNRFTGIFYFVWHGENRVYGLNGEFDASKYIAAHPYTNKNNPWADNPIFAQVPEGRAFYWGEPELGYYSPKDRWVIRRHMQLLVAAGVDTLGFDFTNGHPWSMVDALLAICETIRQMRCEGLPVNIKLLFLTHADSPNTVTWLYDNFFSQNLYPDLWFRWQGKPLILGYPNGLSAADGSVRAEVLNFFNWRTAWAYVTPPSGQTGIPNEWQWIDRPTPQNWGYSTRQDLPEQLPVACGGWANGNLGRSHFNNSQPAYDNYHLPIARTSGEGRFFREQMFYGLKLDPEFLFITGWNEWIAGSWYADFAGFTSMLGNPCPNGGFYFVDEYNQEYSRDIEPVKGEFSDNYYYQLVAQNRLRKGARPVPAATPPATINLADFTAWNAVGPEFRDPIDAFTRNHPSSVSGQPANVNTTGRNDFTLLKVARDSSYLYFLAQCRSNVTSYTGSNWMVLFIDADQQRASGWEGYDFAVNLGPVAAGTTTLSRNPTTTNGWTWQTLRTDLAWQAAGNQFVVRIPRADLGLTNEPLTFDFHWADNFQERGLIADWGVNGDSAPDRRFNYRFVSRSNAPITLVADSFDRGKSNVWGQSWSAGSKWSIVTNTSTVYSGPSAAFCSIANGSGNSYLTASNATTAHQALNLALRFKLQNLADAQNIRVQYAATNGWINIGELTRDEFHPSGQQWGYEERNGVWMQFRDARTRSGTNAAFFHDRFAVRIDASGLTASGQTLYLDDVSLLAWPVLPDNTAPTLAPVGNRVIYSGQPLVITNSAFDPEAPPQKLSWQLLNAPTSATLDTNGIFSWRPAASQPAFITNVRLQVADDGNPSLSSTQSFWVTVNEPPRPRLAATILPGGTARTLVTNTVTGPDYIVQVSTNLNDLQWVTLFTTNVAGGVFDFVEPVSDVPERFYRVLLGP